MAAVNREMLRVVAKLLPRAVHELRFIVSCVTTKWTERDINRNQLTTCNANGNVEPHHLSVRSESQSVLELLLNLL